LDCFTLKTDTIPAPSCSADTIISENCQEIWAPEKVKRVAANEVARRGTDEYKKETYDKMYGGELTAYSLYRFFKDTPIKAAEACKKSPIQVEGVIVDMGVNSYGKYMDLRTGTDNESDIRVFLEDSEWNSNALNKIRRIDKIIVGGLCYGRTEAFGIKSKIIIGNAKILKKGSKYL
jgi:hypothetical protein